MSSCLEADPSSRMLRGFHWFNQARKLGPQPQRENWIKDNSWISQIRNETLWLQFVLRKDSCFLSLDTPRPVLTVGWLQIAIH
jgi:hypothetical protein